MAYSFGYPFFRATDSEGVPLVGGKLYSYEAGTSTPLATFAVSDESGVNTNPVVLDGNGEAVVWLGNNTYKFVLKDVNDVTLWTIDNVNPRIQTIDLEDGSVTTPKIADDAVTTEKIEDDAITQDKLADDSVGNDQLIDESVTEAKLGTSAVTTAKIADLSVTTGKLANGAVTRAKIEALGQQIAPSSGSFLHNDLTPGLVQNQIVEITTSGRPVAVTLLPSVFGEMAILVNGGVGGLFLQRNGVTIAGWSVGETHFAPPLFVDADAPAGTNEYELYAYKDLSATNIIVFECRLCAFEL